MQPIKQKAETFAAEHEDEIASAKAKVLKEKAEEALHSTTDAITAADGEEEHEQKDEGEGGAPKEDPPGTLREGEGEISANKEGDVGPDADTESK